MNFFKELSVGFVLVISLLIVSCGEAKKTDSNELDNLPVYSVDRLKSALPELSVHSIMTFDTSKIIAPYDLVQTLDNNYWISADRLENLIILFNQQGSYLAETGGKGRGPGEFEGAKVLHVGSDNKLYVLDMRAQRITKYQVDKNEFTNISTFSPSSSIEPGSQIRTVYVTEWGNYGVLRKIIDYKVGEQEYFFSELDEEFRLKKRLFTMEGNEKMSLDRWNHVDHFAGKKTFWDMNGEWFYHISSHNTVINKFNIRTGKSISISHLKFEDRRLTDEVKLELFDVAYNMTDRSDKIHEAFVNIEVLPLFQDFMVYDNNYYMVIYNPSGGKKTELVRINELSGEIKYIDLPLSLWKVNAGKNMIYGTVTSGEDAHIRIVKFEE